VIENLSYMAGFFDGEGCVSCSLKRNSNNSKIYFRSAIQVAQIVREPLELFQIRYGGFIYYYKRPIGSNRKPYWVWRLSKNSDALIFLKEMAPLLIVKKQQAIDMIDRIETYISLGPYSSIIPKDTVLDQRPNIGPFSD
jgi:hypothetical protein